MLETFLIHGRFSTALELARYIVTEKTEPVHVIDHNFIVGLRKKFPDVSSASRLETRLEMYVWQRLPVGLIDEVLKVVGFWHSNN